MDNSVARSQIQQYFYGKTIFITGGSGYMGKVLLEKLLYACYDLYTIYLLLRTKRGLGPQERLAQMWQLPLFQRLRKERPLSFKKVVPVEGDVSLDNLGISASVEKLIIEKVSIVFNCAATLKLEANLKESLEINTAGTARVINLCRKIENLDILIHVSTAFCCCDIDVLKEEYYECKDSPHDVYNSSKSLNDKVLEAITTDVIKPHKNTYTYTKRLAEKLIASEFPQLPVVIVRPSIVTPAAIEPLPGWVDSLNGPVGVMIAAAKGVIRSMVVYEETYAHTIPVDVAVNGFIVIAWKHGSKKEQSNKIPVYNMTQDPVIRMTWAECLNLSRNILYKYPFEYTLWYPNGCLTRKEWVHNYRVILYHYIPAYLIDFLMLLFRQKRFLVRIQKRITLGLKMLQFFSTRHWVFEAKNFHGLWTKHMSEEDKLLFCMDFKIISVEEYLKRASLGGRLYCIKEDLSTLKMNRFKLKVLWLLDRVCTTLWYLFCLWVVMKLFFNY